VSRSFSEFMFRLRQVVNGRLSIRCNRRRRRSATEAWSSLARRSRSNAQSDEKARMTGGIDLPSRHQVHGGLLQFGRARGVLHGCGRCAAWRGKASTYLLRNAWTE
jgi:hypothetical protein